MTTKISGLWLPLITPFKDGAIDFASFDRLVNHYIAKGVDGLLPLGTTGESPALDDDEIAAITSFLRSSWGAAAGAVSPQDVARFRGGAGD